MKAVTRVLLTLTLLISSWTLVPASTEAATSKKVVV